jgi:pimeloyl-ACP methyl ester carboxylesterase
MPESAVRPERDRDHRPSEPPDAIRAREALSYLAGLGRPPATPSDGPDPYGHPDPEWLRVDWREHVRQTDVDGTRVNYAEMGEGDPIVFVHGLAGCWQNFLENIPHFARSYRVIALDLPGFGDSPMPDWDVTIPNYGRLVDTFCEQLGLKNSTLVGNSMGGFISAEVAIREPDWVHKLVLVSAAGISSMRVRREPAEAVARMMRASTPLAFDFRARAMKRPRVRWLAFRGLFYNPLRMRSELLWEFYRHGMNAPAFLPAIENLLGYDILDRLEKVRVPTLIVWGRNDRVIPPNDALEYERHVRDSSVVVFDRCGHCPMAERPVRFDRVLDQFIRE